MIDFVLTGALAGDAVFGVDLLFERVWDVANCVRVSRHADSAERGLRDDGPGCAARVRELAVGPTARGFGLATEL